MGRINILPKSVAELIAAGEVVERPASVVKELIENSVDAGADSVTVEIKNGGIRYIRVTDNGHGILREDVPAAFISHATSKISNADDLDSILTLGFRGEALPSIAAVSRLSLLTKTRDDETGTLFTVEGGQAAEPEDAGCPDGTTITVRDLFYNTPARMKFLKKDVTEGTYVSDVVSRTAIARPDIRFTFIRDGKQILSSPGTGELYDAVYAVFGKQIADALIKCEYEHDGIAVNGFISRPLNNRPNRNYQYFYVNGRFVRIPAAAVALDEAYKNSIMVGKFPMCFLNVTIPAGKTDVNVHPAKTEVRFSDEKAVFESVYYAARSALAKGDVARPRVGIPEKKTRSFAPAQSPAPVQYRFDMSGEKPGETACPGYAAPASAPAGGTCASAASDERKTDGFIHSGAVFRDTSSVFSPRRERKESSLDIVYDEKDENVPPQKAAVPVSPAQETEETVPAQETEEAVPAAENNGGGERKPFTGFSEFIAAAARTPAGEPAVTAAPSAPVSTPAQVLAPENAAIPIVPDDGKNETVKILGEVFSTYIVVECGSKLLFIDKHAAHERMIFNSLSKQGGARGSQLLMIPVTVYLPPKEYAAVLENADTFASAGYRVEDFGDNCVLVREIPTELCDADVRDIVTEIAGKLCSGSLRPVPEKLEWLYDSTACRAAVKAGSRMKPAEMEVFVKNLLSDESIRYCPHGRPVMFELTKHEIEKQFGRLG